MYRLLASIIALAFLSSGCGPSGPAESTSREAAAPPAATAGQALPGTPDSLMRQLWERADYIDFVFYNLSFSMSQDQQRDIRLTLQHVARATPAIDPACQPLGRVFFQIEGRNAAEADIFFTPECQYFIFYKNGKKVYANGMTPAGMQFYERVLTMGDGG